MATDLAADVDRAQHALDALVDEQRGLPAQIAHASRGDNPDTWARLALRDSSIQREIRDAGVAVLRARLAQAWAEAEAAMPPAAEARAALADAHRAVDDYEQQRRAPEVNMAEVAQRQLERAHLRDNLLSAQTRNSDATYQVESALLLVDQLEDEHEIATGQRPTPGTGIRATPTPLQATYVLTPPTATLTPAQPYMRDTVPPRWVHYRINRGRTP